VFGRLGLGSDGRALSPVWSAARKRSVRDHAIFRVAFCKALRASEVGILKLADYDPRANTLHVTRLKGSNSGTLPLFTAELAALRAYPKVRGPGPVRCFSPGTTALAPSYPAENGGVSRRP
jgi:integrase